VKRQGPTNIVASVQARLVERSRELGVEHQLAPPAASYSGEWRGWRPVATNDGSTVREIRDLVKLSAY
jgi:hypothetical protein